MFKKCQPLQNWKDMGNDNLEEIGSLSLSMVSLQRTGGDCTGKTTFLADLTMKERFIFFQQVFLYWTKSNKKQFNNTFLPDSPDSSQTKSFVFTRFRQQTSWWDDAHHNAWWCLFIISQEFSSNSLIISFRLNQFANFFTKTFIRKNASWDTLVISAIDFKHDHWSLQMTLENIRQNVRHQVFWSHLVNL